VTSSITSVQGTSVEAIVFGEDGARFFHGLPPVNLAQNNISLTAIQKKLTKLLDADTIIDCCIKTYRIGDTTKFRIFDTVAL